jgi:hypothetical protein
MDSHDLARLAERLAALESFNRRLSRAVVVLLVVLGCTVWMGQRATKKPAPAPPTPKVVEAEQFLLKTPGGRVMATLGAGQSGPALRLLGPNGTERAVFGLDGTGTPRFTLAAADAHPALTIVLGEDGMPTLDLAGGGGTKLRLVAGQNGPGIGLLDTDGTVRLGLDLKADGPLLALTAKDKTDLVSVGATDKGASLALADPDGHPRITFTARQDQAVFGIRDIKGDVRVGLEVRAENPALGLYGPNGKPLFIKP